MSIQIFGFTDPITRNILDQLTIEDDLIRCRQVCKNWQKVVDFVDKENDKIIANYNIIGRKQWQARNVTIKNVPRLTKELIQRLNSPCPIWKGKLTYQTHYCVLLYGRCDWCLFVVDIVPDKLVLTRSVSELYAFVEKPKEGIEYKIPFSFEMKIFTDLFQSMDTKIQTLTETHCGEYLDASNEAVPEYAFEEVVGYTFIEIKLNGKVKCGVPLLNRFFLNVKVFTDESTGVTSVFDF